jgi:hypothetical protein
MPKELTHWILAEQARSRLNEKSRVARVIRDHHSLYLAGAVLPDTLMHLFKGEYSSVALSLANSFHDPEGDSHDPLVRVEERFREGLPPHLLACLLGVISHMLADIAFHPFVFAVTGTDIGGHYRLETGIDLYLLQQGFLPPVRHLSELVSPPVREHLIEAASLLFDPDRKLPQDVVAMALHLHCRYQKMYDSPFWQIAARVRGCFPVLQYRRQQHLFYPLLGMKCEIDNQGNWRCPFTGEQRSETVSDLAEAAVHLMLRLFERIDSHESLKKAFEGEAGANLLTGRHGIREW